MNKLSIKNKKKFIGIFLATFAATALVAVFLLFVVFRGIFYNAYSSKGNARFESGNYEDAIKCYQTARSWKGKKADIYISLAKAYAAMEDYENAGNIIDEAIDKKITSKETGLEQLHLMKIKLFSESGQLADAVNYTESIEDQYIQRQIQAARPADISYSPNLGSYDKTFKMNMTVREGETIYYTTDGSYPTKFSNVYVEPINIGIGETNVTAVAIDSEGLVSSFLTVKYNVTNEYQEVEFDDPKIEAMVREALAKPTGRIRIKELESVTWLSSEGIDGRIKTLSDLDLMPNLEALSLENETSIVSFSPLSGKAKLTNLILIGCGLENPDLNALGGITSLELIDLTGNNITSISALSNLTNLKYVYLSQNRITDISALATAGSIEYIDASQNAITAIPDFDEQSSITGLSLGSNRIHDISTIHRLGLLTYLDLSKNSITNAKMIGQLTKLESLDISGNSIGSFDFLSSLTNLRDLNVSDTSFVSTKPIAKLKLMFFNANNTGIASLDDIANFKDLASLQISSTNVTELSPVASLEALDYLDIGYCNIEDITVLSEFKGLYTLNAPGVDVSGIQFANEDIMVVS